MVSHHQPEAPGTNCGAYFQALHPGSSGFPVCLMGFPWMHGLYIRYDVHICLLSSETACNMHSILVMLFVTVVAPKVELLVP